MKYLVFLTFATSLAFGQEVQTQTLSDKNAVRLDSNQTATIWSQVPVVIPETMQEKTNKARSATSSSGLLPGVAPQQAPIVIEVVSLGETVRVTWRCIGGTTVGTTFTFRIVPPNGIPITMDSWQTSVYQVGYEFSGKLWSGEFPDQWQSGWTKFEVVMIPAGGPILYTSATVPVRACCKLDGPLERVDVSTDGTVINLKGIFVGRTYATLAGQSIRITFSPEGLPWYQSGKIYYTYGNQEVVLTVCSAGECSTRVVYITRPGKG